MTSALTVLNGTSALTTPNQTAGGLGIDHGSKLFTLKPATLNIIQQNSQVEGKKGSIRISETGDVFAEMNVVLLNTPTEQRSYYGGEAGTMNRTPDNLLCFSRDMIAPHPQAKSPQAPKCEGCSQADWSAWRKVKDETGFDNKALRPTCDKFYHALVLDTKFRLPMQLFIRGKSTGYFEKGMDNLYRTIVMAQAQGNNPNIFDVSFTLSTKQITTGKFLSYVYEFSDFKFVTQDQRAAFGEIYKQYVIEAQARSQRSQAPPEPEDDSSDIDNQAPQTSEPSFVSTEEITI